MATWIEKARSPEYSPAKLSQMLAGLESVIGIAELDEAMAGETIIVGGYLNTHLIKAGEITADKLSVDKLSSVTSNTGNLTVGDGNAIELSGDNQRIQATHADGSYTRLSPDGLKRYVAATDFSYNYLMYVGEVVVPITGMLKNNVTIQLPTEFEGKDFKVFGSLITFVLPLTRLLISVYATVTKSTVGNNHILVEVGLTNIQVNTTQGWLKTSVTPEEFKSGWYLSSTFDYIAVGGSVTVQYIVLA